MHYTSVTNSITDKNSHNTVNNIATMTYLLFNLPGFLVFCFVAYFRLDAIPVSSQHHPSTESKCWYNLVEKWICYDYKLCFEPANKIVNLGIFPLSWVTHQLKMWKTLSAQYTYLVYHVLLSDMYNSTFAAWIILYTHPCVQSNRFIIYTTLCKCN